MRFFSACIMVLFLCGSAFASEKDLDFQCLRQAYPKDVLDMKEDSAGQIWLELKGGKQVLYDAPMQEKALSSEMPAISEGPTVRQSMAQPYPLEPNRPKPASGENPGRVRSYALLKALYGNSADAVRAQLKSVKLAGAKAAFSASAGAADALDRVDFLLRECLKREPQYRLWVLPLGGTFKWRNIAGENRLSPHSFGIAVDLNPRKGSYWRWSGKTAQPGQTLYPAEIIKIFESNGFIWGGKWREYDLMHFEYRPEIICKAKAIQDERASATKP